MIVVKLTLSDYEIYYFVCLEVSGMMEQGRDCGVGGRGTVLQGEEGAEETSEACPHLFHATEIVTNHARSSHKLIRQ